MYRNTSAISEWIGLINGCKNVNVKKHANNPVNNPENKRCFLNYKEEWKSVFFNIKQKKIELIPHA
jgi:hypothetical protein